MGDYRDNPLETFFEEEGLPIDNSEQPKRLYDLSGNWVDPAINYPPPRYLFTYNGVGFSPLGGMQVITGHRKNGKSFFTVQIMAAALGSTKLGGLRLNVGEGIPKEPVVLYIDTEMEIENCSLMLKRVHALIDFDINQRHPRFFALWLCLESPEDRWGKVRQAIEEVNPDLIVLDGIRDVTRDINDPDGCSELVAEVGKIARRRNACFWNAIHYNDNNEKIRGWLGTELGNKATDIFEVTKEKKGDVVSFTVKQKDGRGKDVPGWIFMVKDTIWRFGVPVIMGGSEEVVEKDEMKLMDEYLSSFMEKNGEPMSMTKIWKGMYDQCRKRNHAYTMNDMKDLAELCKMQKILIAVKGGYRYVGIGWKPNANDQQLPFPRSDDS